MRTLERNTVTSADGTAITYATTGQGPGLVIVHGALSDIEEYTQLAMALSRHYTIYLMQRRDRQGLQAAYSIEQDCQDLLALQQYTGAEYVFGHSFGGLVVLETAISHHPFRKIAVYEPGVSIKTKWDWLTVYETAMASGQYRKAFTAFVQGMGHSPLTKAPGWLVTLVLKMAIRGDEWKLKKGLLVSNLHEHQEVRRLESTYKKYAAISVPVLLAGGKASPDFIPDMLNIVTQEIPRSQVLLIPALQHLAPQNNEAPEIVASHLIQFFGSALSAK